MKEKQLILSIWANAIGGAIYDTMIRSAKQVDENCTMEQQQYYDEE